MQTHSTAIAVLAALWLGVAGVALAANPSAESGAFASIDVGAAALGMGGAGTVLDQSAWAAYWNPANLFHLEGREVAVDYVDLFGLDLARHTAVAFAWRTEPKRNVIRDGRVVEVPRQTDRLAFGLQLHVTSVDLAPETYSEVTPAFSMAGKPFANLAVGGTFKVHLASTDLDDLSATGYSIDLGTSYAFSRDWNAALAIKNVLSNISWSTNATDQLVTDLTAGIGYAGFRDLRLAVEVTASSDHELRDARLGGEWTGARGALRLRGGAILRADRNDDNADLTFGAGTGVEGLHADYAFVSQGDVLGDTHRFSLSLRF